jgi:hypothetical protein
LKDVDSKWGRFSKKYSEHPVLKITETTSKFLQQLAVIFGIVSAAALFVLDCTGLMKSKSIDVAVPPAMTNGSGRPPDTASESKPSIASPSPKANILPVDNAPVPAQPVPQSDPPPLTRTEPRQEIGTGTQSAIQPAAPLLPSPSMPATVARPPAIPPQPERQQEPVLPIEFRALEGDQAPALAGEIRRYSEEIALILLKRNNGSPIIISVRAESIYDDVAFGRRIGIDGWIVAERRSHPGQIVFPPVPIRRVLSVQQAAHIFLACLRDQRSCPS